MTPGGRAYKPVISQFTKLTPLIDSLGKNKRFSQQSYVNQPGGGHWINGAGVLATPAIGYLEQKRVPANYLAQMTPRSNALYATKERNLNVRSDAPLVQENPISMAKNYSQVPVYKLAK